MCAVNAARNMSTERRRATTFDGAHHLHLIEADVPCVHRTPGSTVGAEDIGDLQLLPAARQSLLAAMRGGQGGLWRAFLALFTFGSAKIVQRALHGGDHASCDTGIPRCRGQFGVSEQGLDHPDIDTALKQVGRKTVP